MEETLTDIEQDQDQLPEGNQPPKKLKVSEFAAKVKEKYPEYKDIEDSELTKKIIDKYPEYKEQVDFKKKVGGEELPSETPSTLQSDEIIPTVDLLNTKSGKEKPIIDDTPDGNFTASDNPIDIARNANDYLGRTKEVANDALNNQVAITKQVPDQDYIDYGNKQLEALEKSGIENPKQLSEDFKDFPEEAFKGQNTSKEALIQLRKDNPIEYKERINDTKTVYNIAKNSDVHTANQFNHLNNMQFATLNDFIDAKKQQQSIIDHTLTGKERDIAQQRLKENASKFINPEQPDLIEEYNNSPIKDKVDPTQYAGLKTEEIFEPEKYKRDIAILSLPETHKYIVNLKGDVSFVTTDKKEAERLGGTESQTTIDQQVGREKILMNLNNTGKKNTYDALTKEQFDLEKAYKNETDPIAQGEIQKRYVSNQQKIIGIEEDAKQDIKKFPLLSKLLLDNQLKELNQQTDQNVFSYAGNRFLKGFENTNETWEDLVTNFTGSDKDKAALQQLRLGETERYENKMFLPSSLTKSQNLFSKANLYKVAGFTGDVASFMAQTALGGGGRTAELATLFNTTYSDAYNQATEEGMSSENAHEAGILHGGVMMLAGLFGSKYEQVKNVLAEAKSPLAKEIAGMGEGAWDAIINKNKGTINRIAKSALSTGKEQAKMIGIYGVGISIANDLVDKGFFNKDISTGEMIDHAVNASKDMAIGGLALGGIGFLNKVRKNPVTMMDKMNMWENGDNPDIGKARIDEAVQKGDLSAKDGEVRKKEIDNIANLIQKVPERNNRLDHLTPKEKVNYLYNLILKDKATEAQKDLPEKQSQEAEHDKLVAEHKNQLILEQPTDKQLEAKKTKLEKSLIPEKDADGKNIEIPEKELLQTNAELEAVNNEIDLRNRAIKPEEGELPFGQSGTTGIAHGSQMIRAVDVKIPQPERGEGVTAEEATKHGQDLLAKGEDAQKAADDFKKDNKISYDALSLVRAKHAELVKATNKAIDDFGENSQQAKDALKTETDWYNKVVRPMKTEWHKIGMGTQGETDIDTGSFVGLKRAYQQATGKEFTNAQAKSAKAQAEKVASLTKEVEDLKSKLTSTIDEAVNEETKNTNTTKSIKERAKSVADTIRRGKLSRPNTFSAASPASLVWDGALEAAAKTIEAGGIIAQAIGDGIKHIKESDWYKGLTSEKQKEAEDTFRNHMKDNVQDENLFTKYINKTDSKFSPEEVKEIWGYAKKEYLDKGRSYEEMLRGVGNDLNLNTNQVRDAISQPKGAKPVTDALYKLQQRRTDAINEAKYWVKKQQNGKFKNFIKAVPNFFFGLKVFGHGTVGAITHAGMNIFQPSRWAKYFPFFIKQFKYAFGSTADYAKAMEDLKNDKDFTFWQRAGLAVDPDSKYDDYQGSSNYLGKWFRRASVAGDRGFNALKVYRLELAKSFYDGLSNSEKADPETAKEIAKLVNHSTGTSEVRMPKWSSTIFFAPKLEASRWQGLITDPAKATKTFINWQNATPAEKAAAKRVAKNAGEKLATYTVLLAANQGLLIASGSKQRINFTNPLDNDWLKFKTGDKTIDVSGGMLSTMRFISSLLNEAHLAYTGDKKDLREKPGEKNAKAIATQARYKLSPFASTVVDLVTGTDAMGRPLPYSNVKPKKGEEPHSIWSYLTEQELPIPISEGIRETIGSMKQSGMSDPDIIDVLKGIGSGVLTGGTGVKLQDIPDQSGKTMGGGGASGDFPKPHTYRTHKTRPNQ